MDNLKPFKKFCIHLGVLPSAYVECMSYYEALTYVIKYLTNEVIPTVNNNSDVVTELQNYVEHYFDNLDVQEEINNKLDEMAESGELVELIGEYLNSKAITGFNTTSEMVSATNLIDGSICKTIGNNSINDGFGSFYKVREITESDNPDGYNLVTLDDETLVAEKIINNNFNLNYYLGAFHRKYSELDKRIYLFLSNDGINFSEIPNIEIQGESSSGGADPSILYDEESKTFLIAYSNQDDDECFTILKSKDLINWSEHPISLTLPANINGWNKWAPDLFRDENGNIKLIFSADKTQNGFDFENLITELTDIENLTFTSPYEIVISNPTSIYDCSIVYFNELYYMVATDFNKILLYTSEDLTNFTLVNENLFENYYLGANNERALEGCNLCIENGKLIVYSELPNISRFVCGEINTNTYKIKNIININSLQGLKHGSVMNIDSPSSKNTLNKISKNIINENALIPLEKIETIITLQEDTTLSNYTLYPNEILVINGNGYELTINKIKDPYHLYKLNFIIYDEDGELNIGQYEEDQYSSYTYKGTLGSGKKEKTVDFRFNALDNSYDYLALDSGVNELTLPEGFTGNIWYHKVGRVVNVQFNFNGTYSYGLLIGTLPSGYRPSHQIATLVVNRNHEDDNEGIIISPDGGIAYIGYNTSGNIVGNITYLI